MWRAGGLIVMVAVLAGCRSVSPVEPIYPAEDTLPVRVGEAYLGLGLWHGEQGEALVSVIMPGPMEGERFTSPYVQRGDLLLSADGQAMTAEAFSDYMKTKRPGDSVTLTFQHTEGDPHAAFPQAGEGTETSTHTFVLSHKQFWTGPIFAKPPADRIRSPEAVGPSETLLEGYLRDQLLGQQLEEPVTRLLELFHTTQAKRDGFHMLSRVSDGFRRPLVFPQLCRQVTDPLADLTAEPRLFFREARLNLDATDDLVESLPMEDLDYGSSEALLDGLVARAEEADSQLAQAFAEIDQPTLDVIPGLVDHFLNNWGFQGKDPHLVAHGLRATMQVDYDALLRAGEAWSDVLAAVEPPESDEWTQAVLPRALREAVSGTILGARRVGDRWYVIGGPADNTYDLSVVDVVLDLGGQDQYRYPDDPRQRQQVVIDHGGDDTYSGAGAVSACLGLSLVVDHAGRDTYSGETRSVASALLGVALLVDHAGHDTYRSTSWGQGAAIYGTAGLLDLQGNDVYWSHHASQGIGGPRGFGLLFDRAGADIYRANGPTGSVYGTPAVFYGMSQGVGFGFRGYDSGGIGVLYDGNGLDRYEAGEFSQGGGYYWGLGILDDRSGNDLYYGNRYGQGFGCHQALGALLDHSGNDTYWTMAAANQGAAWDIGMGMLLDYRGDDTYKANGLAQGGASMQAIGWLLDLAGNDHYSADARASHGESGGDSYHYFRTRLFSWSLLLDAGGQDFYSTGRPNDTILTTGQYKEEEPRESTLHGLFLDLAEPPLLDLQ